MAYTAFKKHTRRMLHSQATGYLFVAPAILFLLTFTAYPLLRALLMSLSKVSNKGEIGAWIGFENWLLLLQDTNFINALSRSLKFSLLGTLGALFVGIILAQLLNMDWLSPQLSNFLRGLSVMPWIFSMSVAALMWGLILHRDGFVNAMLLQTGLIQQPKMFVGNPDSALPSLSVIFMWRIIPFIMVMIIAGLKATPLELYEAASVDGANKWQAYWRITIPLIMPLILTLAILGFVWGMGQFDLIKIITGGGPMQSTEVVSFYIYRVGFLTVNWSYGSTISIGIFLVNLLFAVAYLYVSKRTKPWG